MTYTFTADGKWTFSMDKGEQQQIKQTGTYTIKGKRVTLNKDDGSTFDEWKAELKDNGNALNVQGKEMLMHLKKLPTAQ